MSCLGFSSCRNVNIIPDTVLENPLQRVIRDSIKVSTYSLENHSYVEYRVPKYIINISSVLKSMIDTSIDGKLTFPPTQLTYSELKRIIGLIESKGKLTDPSFLEEDIALMEFFEFDNVYINFYVSHFIDIANYSQLLQLWKHFLQNINKKNIMKWMTNIIPLINTINCSEIDSFIKNYKLEKMLTIGEATPLFHEIQKKIKKCYSLNPPKISIS